MVDLPTTIAVSHQYDTRGISFAFKLLIHQKLCAFSYGYRNLNDAKEKVQLYSFLIYSLVVQVIGSGGPMLLAGGRPFGSGWKGWISKRFLGRFESSTRAFCSFPSFFFFYLLDSWVIL